MNKYCEIRDWATLGELYGEACFLSATPGKNFRKVKDGEVIDEDKSVRWNREEVKRIQEEYFAEERRLIEARRDEILAITDRACELVAEETDLPLEKAKILWNFVDSKYHAYGETFRMIEDYIELVSELLAE